MLDSLVFEARLEDDVLHEGDEIVGSEEGQPFIARWILLVEFTSHGPPLYPHGLLEMLLPT